MKSISASGIIDFTLSCFVFLKEILSKFLFHIRNMSTINRWYTIERNSCLAVSMKYTICKFLISLFSPLFPTLRRDLNTSFFLSPHWKAYFCPSSWSWENRTEFFLTIWRKDIVGSKQWTVTNFFWIEMNKLQ